MTRERLIDEMALALCQCPELGSDEACISVLLSAGYRGGVINDHLDEARKIARAAMAGEADLWNGTQYK
jgi:hypothetical protein